MVLHKKSDYGFNGYRAPEVPQTSRPIRKKRSNLRRNLKADPMGAIDMLATVAGMLLDEKPSLGKDIAKMENNSCRNKSLGVDGKPINAYQQCYEASCDEGDVVIGGDRNGQTTSGGSVMSGGSSSFVKVEETKYGSEEVVAMVDGKKIGVKFEDVVMGKSTVPLEDGDIHMDGKPPALVSSDSSADVPSCRDNAISCNNSSPLSIKDGKGRDQHGDDEENSSGCTHPGPIASEPSRFEGDKRRRKVCNSKFWKVGPTLLKDGGEFSSRDVDSKFRSRKMCCRRQRTQRPPFKKGKLQERNIAESKPVVENGVKVEGSNSTEYGMPMPSLAAEPKTSAETGDSRVKLRIKSFKIPELFIEMPESATVGCLKRTVLETVTEMVENGLGVGVILQGKEVRDDSRTLEQTGITHEKKLDSLGFTLEPNPTLSPPKETPPILSTCESPKPLARLPALLPTTDAGIVINSNPDASESPCQLGSSSIDQHDPNPSTSRALVPAVAPEPLALVPHSGRKPRKTEASQRRIRRPFSVVEVEALVQAVEKLGTGRWRDVKLRAFDDAKHRTYVDLKDKWKTLVHTARISPQQRRGEPVPQELLDRVLTAHAYWSQHQAKLQVKPTQPKVDRCPVQALTED